MAGAPIDAMGGDFTGFGFLGTGGLEAAFLFEEGAMLRNDQNRKGE
jgi:hypothetical protein